MHRPGWTNTMTGVAALAALVGGPASVASAQVAEPTSDPAVVAARTTAAAAPQPTDYTHPSEVQPGLIGSASRSMQGSYLLSAKSTSGGYIEVAGRDNPAQDKLGFLTTTLRIYGNAAAFRQGAGPVRLRSVFTCTGIGISSLSIGMSGASVTSGSTSSTLTLSSSRTSSSVVRQNYTEGGHFRCSASNLAYAKFTRRVTGTATYKQTDTRAEDSYSFWW